MALKALAALGASVPTTAAALQEKKASSGRKRLELNAKPPVCPECKNQGEVKCNCGPSRRRGCLTCRGSGRMQGEADESVGVGTGRKPLERKVAVTRTCTTCNGAGKTACRFCTDGRRACRRCFGVAPAARAEHDLLLKRREHLVWKDGTFTKGKALFAYEGPASACAHVIEASGSKLELSAATMSLDKKLILPSWSERNRRVVVVSTAVGGLTDLELSGAVGSTYSLRITPVGFESAFQHASSARSFGASSLFFVACSPNLNEKAFDAFLHSNSRSKSLRSSQNAEPPLLELLGAIEKHQPQFRSLADFSAVMEEVLRDAPDAKAVRDAIESVEKGDLEEPAASRLLSHRRSISFLGTMVHLVDRVVGAPMTTPSGIIKNEHLGTR
jgi:hypothetical protein